MKIETLKIQSFRGIPKELNIGFLKGGDSVSMLLFGDNGSGKSSMIDAIEFCLQARINRTKHLNNEFFPFPVSFYSNSDSQVEIKFAKSNNTISRKIFFPNAKDGEELSFRQSNSQPHESFRISPIVLRRKDILDFNNAPIRRKQVVLFDFLRDSEKEDWESNPPMEIEKLNNERNKIKNKRNQTINQLATILKIRTEDIPLEKGKFDNFIRDKVYKGLNKKQRNSLERRGRRLQVNEKALHCVRTLRKYQTEVININSQVNILMKENKVKLDKKKITCEILVNASTFISNSFNKIAKIDYVEKIYLKFGKESEVALSIEVELKNGKIGNPNNIFSEAYLDLIALLIFLAFLKESTKFGQSKLLILDDVLQSVDSTIRLSFADFLLKEFHDWQLIISAHDRLWLNQLRSLFRQNNHRFNEKEIIRWDFSDGPILKNGNSNIDDTLDQAIEAGEFEIICSQTGILLEIICNELSFRLPISVKRKYEDKYTLGDMWPGIFKILKKTNLKNEVESVETFIHLRNLIGAHYNSWAYSLSSSEAYDFGYSAINLYRKVYCKSCHTWIKNINNERLFQCRCKKLTIQ